MKHLKIKIDKYEVDGEEILKDIEFTLNKSDRISIVGGNGAGKTTILKIITGEIKNFDGFIENIGSVTLGYLAQIYNDNENKTVYDELKDGFVDIVKLEKELEQLEKKMNNGKDIFNDSGTNPEGQSEKLNSSFSKDKTKSSSELMDSLSSKEGQIEQNTPNSVIPANAGIYEKNQDNLIDPRVKHENDNIDSSSGGHSTVNDGQYSKKLEGLSQDELIQIYSDKLEQFNNFGGYNYNSILMGVASGLGITSLLKSKLNEISGGQRTKVALGKILIHSPDILFLDEPTNFIDMASLEWLEFYLQNKWHGGYVIVSHDREFLDKTCSKTYEIQPVRPINFYHCSYSEYVIERDKLEKKIAEDFERQRDWIEKQEGLVNRFRAGSRAGWAKSREKMIDKMDKLEPPYIPHKAKFLFQEANDSGNKVLSFKQVFIGRKDPLFFINDLVLYKGQKIGIVGENGVGKSTFIKSILGQIEFLDGYFSKAKGLQIGYYSQMHDELKKDKTIRENFILHGFDYPEQHLIAILKHYLFDYEDINKKVENLSGGQISKLAFAILGQKQFDLLILDEPTNHLDYDTREALESALNKYNGTLLFISHDRYFVNKIATNIWIIKDGELSVSYGNYEDYKYKQEHGIDMDMSLFDEEGQLNLVLEEKLGEKEFKRLKNKFKKFRRK
ncbi:MAG: ABC-F family ATP-binding cassette domain-containing protein [Candidatus Gracilibacteria bacterium]|nr:ABC-F family ATP-binding cassette domain-containing protein [Candidatus Gracilibacteria bacterium]